MVYFLLLFITKYRPEYVRKSDNTITSPVPSQPIEITTDIHPILQGKAFLSFMAKARVGAYNAESLGTTLTHVAAMLLTALPFLLLLLIPSSSYHLGHLVHLVHLIHLVHLVNSSPSHLVHLLPPHFSNGKFPLDRPPHLPPPPSYTLLGHQQQYHHPALPPLPHPVLLHPQELQRHECWVG